MTRTNIEIDDTCVAVIVERYGVTTKTDAVDLLATDRDLMRVADVVGVRLDAG